MATQAQTKSVQPKTAPLPTFQAESKMEQAILRRCPRCGATVEEKEQLKVKTVLSQCNHGIFFDEKNKRKTLTDNVFAP